jgi:hypothetical protein
VEKGALADRANKSIEYKVAHYAGSGPTRCLDIFRHLIREFYTGHGPPRPRWGIKWLGLCADPDAVAQIETLWPETRWVICLRDPFRTVESVKNTFLPDADTDRLRDFAADWVRSCRFASTHTQRRTIGLLFDRLNSQSPKARLAMLNRTLALIDEQPTPETDSFVGEWPTVHKAKPDDARTFRLSPSDRRELLRDVDGLADCMESLGYPIP